jgi:hypothetical protein
MLFAAVYESAFGPFRKWRDVRYLVVLGGKAELEYLREWYVRANCLETHVGLAAALWLLDKPDAPRLHPSVERRSHPAECRAFDMLLHIDDGRTGIGLVPRPVIRAMTQRSSQSRW